MKGCIIRNLTINKTKTTTKLRSTSPGEWGRSDNLAYLQHHIPDEGINGIYGGFELLCHVLEVPQHQAALGDDGEEVQHDVQGLVDSLLLLLLRHSCSWGGPGLVLGLGPLQPTFDFPLTSRPHTCKDYIDYPLYWPRQKGLCTPIKYQEKKQGDE